MSNLKLFGFHHVSDKPDQFRPYREIIEERHPILFDLDLLKMIDKEFDKKIVKEHETRKVIFLVALGGCLVENCQPTSKNLMVNDESGAGKDYITRSVLKILPEKKVETRQRISEKAFTYWHNKKFEPDWTWDDKVFYGEDLANNILNSDVFKVMSSQNGINKSTIIVNHQPVDIEIVGKPVMIITIAAANPNAELLRRYPIANLDTTTEQTKLILKRKAQFAKDGIVPDYSQDIKKAFYDMQRVKVKVPFADKLVDVLSPENIIIRTHFDRFIDYIKFSAAIHQWQRVIDEDKYIHADGFDYEIAREALIKTTSNALSIPLTKKQQKILETIKEMGNLYYSASELEPKFTFSERTLRTQLDKLTEHGFLEKTKEERSGASKPVMVYKYKDCQRISIPTWEELEYFSNASNASNASSTSSTSKGGVNEANEAIAMQNEVIEIEDLIEEEKENGN